MLKIGVILPSTVEDAGDFLANVRALEAAGAELIGVEGDSPAQLPTSCGFSFAAA
jgi:hypothetical protein